MSDEEIKSGSSGDPPKRKSRRVQLTPGLRRLLAGRSAKGADREGDPENHAGKASRSPGWVDPRILAPNELPSAPAPTDDGPSNLRSVVDPTKDRASRVNEIGQAALIIGAVLLLALLFYFGKKFDSWKSAFGAQNKTSARAAGLDKFPGLTSDELVEKALTDEKGGHWREAAEKLIAAKKKNLAYRGILFRVGKLCFDHGSYASADQLFERSITFGENVDSANFYRALIATNRRDFTAAERFCEAAVKADAFRSDYYYHWGEVARLNHKPTEAVAHYEQAALRAHNEQDAAVCRFKMQMARLEAGDVAAVADEVEKKRMSGPLSVAWLMSAAAVKIRQDHYGEATDLLSQAWSAYQPGLFAACSHDLVFLEACRRHPEIVASCHLDVSPQGLFP